MGRVAGLCRIAKPEHYSGARSIGWRYRNQGKPARLIQPSYRFEGTAGEITMAATDRFEIPQEMRAFAEKSVEQAKQAFDGFMSAAQNAVTAFEGHAESARKGARHVTDKAMSFAEQNVSTSFDFAQKLLRAKDLQEVMRLQAEFVRSQMQVLAEQARELGETAGKAASEVRSPKSS